MDKEQINKILQACMLMSDDMPEKEVIEMVDKSSFVKAEYLMGFLKSYKY